MSVLLAATISLGQLCYDADNDINANDFIRGANHFHQQLVEASDNKKSACWNIATQSQLDEAQQLVLMDSTGETLVVK